MKKILIISILFSSVLFSKNNREEQEMNFDDTYYIKLYNDAEIARKTKKAIDLGKLEEYGMLDVNESLKPLMMPLKDISLIKVHESKNPTVLLPKNTVILSADSFPKAMVGTVKDYNTFEIFPSSDLVGANVTVRYMVDNNIEDIRVMKINVEKYIHLESKKSIYYPIIQYYNLDKEIFTWDNVIEGYNKLKGHYPKGTDMFELNGVGITILEDEINGTHLLGNKRYRLVIDDR